MFEEKGPSIRVSHSLLRLTPPVYSSEMAGLGTGGGGGGLLAAQTGRHSELLYKQQELLTWLGIGVHAGTRSSKEAEAKVHLAFRNCV